MITTTEADQELVAEAHAWLDQLERLVPMTATELAQPIHDWMVMLAEIGEGIGNFESEMTLDKSVFTRCEALADELTRAGNLAMTWIGDGLSGLTAASSQAPTQIRAIFEEITHVSELRRDICHARESHHDEAAAS